MTDTCGTCHNRRLVATDESKSPWSAWENLRPPEDMAVRLGLVRAEPCPECCPNGLDDLTRDDDVTLVCSFRAAHILELVRDFPDEWFSGLLDDVGRKIAVGPIVDPTRFRTESAGLQATAELVPLLRALRKVARDAKQRRGF